MDRQALLKTARADLAHAKAGTIQQMTTHYEVPADHYVDEERWQREVDLIFNRLPLMLATTAELPNVHDYKAMTILGVPILIARGENGAVQAFFNVCSHRGAQIMPEGRGNSHRFTCPYHAWSYNHDGKLIGVFAERDFGEVDRTCYSLQSLPCLERAGLIWVHLDPNPSLSINDFLCGYDRMLQGFGFEGWHYFDSQMVEGPNWKIAYDGYLDIYHLPILHKDTFGSNFPHRANYYPFGPHQRVSGPNPSLLDYEQIDENEWPLDALMGGVWTIFPHISIAGFDGGGGGVLLSQLFPGATPSESVTIQHYLLKNTPDEAASQSAAEQFKFLRYVVEQEDYATGIRQQVALASGARKMVTFGKNESGGARFHAWVDQLLETSDSKLASLFQEPVDPIAEMLDRTNEGES